MNCIQEGLIPSKYFKKSTERLVSTNGSQMKIKYELNNAHVCHDNIRKLINKLNGSINWTNLSFRDVIAKEMNFCLKQFDFVSRDNKTISFDSI